MEKNRIDGNVFVVTLDSGITVVFKNIPAEDFGDAHAEVAAYQASLYLGFPYVSPTVIRTINGISGSLQLYIETEIDPLADGKYHQATKEVDIKRWI